MQSILWTSVFVADTNMACQLSTSAGASLNAVLHHWRNGEPIQCRTWISQLLDDVTPLARDLNLDSHLKPLEAVLSSGNQAMRWQTAYDEGAEISELLRRGILTMASQEQNSPVMDSILG